MSVRVMNWVWEHSQTRGNELIVLLAIADAADDDGTNAWPTIARLAAKCRLSPATVRRAIRALVELGELAVERNAGGRWDTLPNRRPNRYQVLMTPSDPSADGAVDNSADEPDFGVSNCDPKPDLGCQDGPSGVSDSTVWGVTADTQPILTHPYPSTTTRARGRDTTDPASVDGGGGVPDSTPAGGMTPLVAAEALLDQLGPSWRLGRAQRRHISREVDAALAAGWPANALAELLGANRDGVRSPYAVLRTRLADLPSPPGPPRPRPLWCGRCDQKTRLEDTGQGLRRCPRCHPLTRSDDAAPAA